MHLELVTIGDELLLGFTIDTNAAHLARELSALGIRIVRRTTAGDEPESIASAVRDALDRTGAVITTGGLGPTADDRTKPVIAGLFGRGMRMDDGILHALEARWLKRFGHALPESNRQQAMVPEGATILANQHGSAPGIWLEDERGRWVAMLPGVPREMRGMLADTIVPLLQGRVGEGATVVRSRTLRTVNISESALADRLGELAGDVLGMSVAFLPGSDGVDLRITSAGLAPGDADALLDRAAALLRQRAGNVVYGTGDDDLAALVLSSCEQRGFTMAVAESCTGGMLGGRLTAVPGASRVFHGGVIAYANEVKLRELGVDASDIAVHGAVSEAVARAMASGVRHKFGTTVGLSITGIAGPDGGSEEKPVGTVWVGLDVDGATHAVRAVLPGNRDEIRYRATQTALDRLRRAFERTASDPGWTTKA